MQAYTPSLSASLGVYIPLIVVNCIIMAEPIAMINNSFIYSASYSCAFFPVHMEDCEQLAQSPVRHPEGAARGLPFFSILSRMTFMPATKKASTRNAPGAIMKTVIPKEAPKFWEFPRRQKLRQAWVEQLYLLSLWPP